MPWRYVKDRSREHLRTWQNSSIAERASCPNLICQKRANGYLHRIELAHLSLVLNKNLTLRNGLLPPLIRNVNPLIGEACPARPSPRFPAALAHPRSSLLGFFTNSKQNHCNLTRRAAPTRLLSR